MNRHQPSSNSQNVVFGNQQQMQMPPGSYSGNMMPMCPPPPLMSLQKQMNEEEKPRNRSEFNLSELSRISEMKEENMADIDSIIP